MPYINLSLHNLTPSSSLQLGLFLDRPNLKLRPVLLQHTFIVILYVGPRVSISRHNHNRHDQPISSHLKSEKRTFQNCLLASFPPTRFSILDPPGCSSTNVSSLYTSPSMIMYSPFSTVLCSATCFTVSDSDIVVVIVVRRCAFVWIRFLRRGA